jgi:hypothetical protein
MQVCSASDTGAALAYFNNLCASAGSFASGIVEALSFFAFEMTHRASGLTNISPAASLTSGSGSVFGTGVFSYPTT